MFNSTVLDVMVGLTFVYLLLALICTTVNEWLAGILKTRGKMLAEGIAALFQGQSLERSSLLDAFQAHPLVSSLNRRHTLPSYMPPRTFALALMDLLTPQQPGAIEFSDLVKGINNLPDGPVKKTLLTLVQTAKGDVAQAQQSIESWFNEGMDRVTGWYTRRKQVLTVVISAVLVIFVNADTLGMAHSLWINPTLRQQLVDRAKSSQPELATAASTETNPQPGQPGIKTSLNPDLSAAEKLSGQLQDLVGWSADWSQFGFSTERKQKFDSGKFVAVVGMHIPGWILSIIAVSLGAPFWFDALKSFMNIRAAGQRPPDAGKGTATGTGSAAGAAAASA
jgi:hypothetical protein